MIKVSNALDAIFMSRRMGLNSENDSIMKNSAQYISEMENTYFRYTATPNDRNDGIGIDISSSRGK